MMTGTGIFFAGLFLAIAILESWRTVERLINFLQPVCRELCDYLKTARRKL